MRNITHGNVWGKSLSESINALLLLIAGVIMLAIAFSVYEIFPVASSIIVYAMTAFVVAAACLKVKELFDSFRRK